MSGNIDILRGGEGPAGPSEDAFTRKVETRTRTGRSGIRVDRSDLFGYDRHQGMLKAYGVGTDVADRMPPEAVKRSMERIREAFGVQRANEGFSYGFDRALLICHALNGASQIAPSARVMFYVVNPTTGEVDEFNYGTVCEVLGVNLRRFFRGIADETVDICHDLYDNCSLTDKREIELRAQMIALADKRGISRFPWLVADSVDAALNLDAGQMAAVMDSKRAVIGRTPNAVDTRNLAVPIRSSDNYDSSNGRHVSADNDIHSGSQYYS